MNEYNKYNAACPDDLELVAYKEGSLPAEDKQSLTEHLLLCGHCLLQLELLPWNTVEEMERAMIEDDSEEAEETEISPILERAFDIYRKKQAAKPKSNPQSLEQVLAEDGLEVGQIWRTKLEQIVVPLPDGEEIRSVSKLGSVWHLVVITNISVETRRFLSKEYHIIKIIPVDDNFHYARDNDVVFREDENPLNYPFMLSTWNQQEMLRENLDSCLGKFDISPASFKTLPNTNGRDILSFLVNKGFEAISNTNYSLLSIVKKGLYSDEAMRHRAREFENTTYLRAPVRELRESLTLGYEEVVSKSSILTNLRKKVVDFFTPVVKNQEIQFEAGEFEAEESESTKSKNIKVFFDGKLTSEIAEIDETGAEKEVIFHSDDPSFDDKFILLGTEDEPVILISLLSGNDKSRKGYTSRFILKSHEVTKLWDGKLFDATELSKLLDDGAVTKEIIHDSISRVNTFGLQAWRKVAEAESVNEDLKTAILGQELIKDN